MHHRLLSLLVAGLLLLVGRQAGAQGDAGPPTVYELPPTRPQGPVVLDVPYEAVPPGDEDLFVPSTGFPEDFVDLWAPKQIGRAHV